MRKDLSPLMERDTFALFDEPRCRGVDLKLRDDAIALLTLGQKICKDKVMQATGRMRQLSDGQRLIIAEEPNIFKEINRVTKFLCQSQNNGKSMDMNKYKVDLITMP
jgi:hypothetical protein